ncbi:hypothetical protein [Thermoactinospora rubra]|uniref:hypothetical protein n=1 Tax=Thermoactinospora rubra TaxID=1088767 RepID=UPI00117EBC88|nr:hypothetical protein [Thermoactinospora rubra]
MSKSKAKARRKNRTAKPVSRPAPARKPPGAQHGPADLSRRSAALITVLTLLLAFLAFGRDLFDIRLDWFDLGATPAASAPATPGVRKASGSVKPRRPSSPQAPPWTRTVPSHHVTRSPRPTPSPSPNSPPPSPTPSPSPTPDVQESTAPPPEPTPEETATAG